MKRSHLFWVLLALLGLVLRIWGLPLWGTFDTEVQKAWAARAAVAGVADIYGPSDREVIDRAGLEGGGLVSALLHKPFPRTEFRWGSATYFVDYPPGSVLVLFGAGKLWVWIEPDMPNRRGFNAAINLAPLIGAMVIAALLFRSAPAGLGRHRCLAFWLNPAILLAAPVLGYQDTIFGAFALQAVLALMAGGYTGAAAWTLVAVVVKPQGALLLPILAAVLLREARPVVWLRAALAGTLAALLLLAPWWLSGHLLSALDGCRRPLGQVTLAPLGLNVWWIAGWLMDVSGQTSWPLARIVEIREFAAWAQWDPRLPSRLLLLVATVLNLFLLLRAPREDRARIPLAVILQVHAYALLGTSVHENHTFLAVIVAPLLMGAWPRATGVLATTSGFLLSSLFLAAGFGRKITRLATIRWLRGATGIDLSVIVAGLHVALVIVLFAWAWRCKIRADD